MRIVHSDLGHLAVGLTFVYALSGLAVNHITDWGDGDPSFHNYNQTHELGPGITPLQAGLGWVVGWDKGEFRGDAALAAERERGIARRLRGITIDGRRPAREHTPVSTDDNNACTTDACDPATGVRHIEVTCNDGSACTTDTCDPATGCVFTTISCDDGNACTADSCNPATGCTYTALNCDDKDKCTTDSCDPAIGCVNVPVVCDPGLSCQPHSGNCI